MQSASSVTLNVVVTDCNDNPPVFNMSSYEVIINESQAATTMRETILDSIDTTDEDGTAADRAVTYMIVTAAGIPDWFDVDSTSVSVGFNVHIIHNNNMVSANKLNLRHTYQCIFLVIYIG